MLVDYNYAVWHNQSPLRAILQAPLKALTALELFIHALVIGQMSVRDKEREREREMAIVFRGHRYTLWNQDCTCIAAYEAMRREGMRA